MALADLACADMVSESDCTALGGTSFLVNESCTGADSHGFGLDDSCPGAVPALLRRHPLFSRKLKLQYWPIAL